MSVHRNLNSKNKYIKKLCNFFHISNKKDIILRNVKQDINWKPAGIYMAKNNTWKNYIKKEIGENSNIYKYKVIFDNKLNLCKLNNFKDVEYFVVKYGNKNDKNKTKNKYTLINWKLVAEDYDGIYITTKVLNTSNKKKDWITKHLFITMFDVETICVWNIKKIKLEIVE